MFDDNFNFGTRNTVKENDCIHRPGIWDLERGSVADVYETPSKHVIRVAPITKKATIEMVLNNPTKVLIKWHEGVGEWVKLNQIATVWV